MNSRSLRRGEGEYSHECEYSTLVTGRFTLVSLLIRQRLGASATSYDQA
jgi:hypothetical protein